MFYLGIDGGGTKTAFAVISADGKILAYLTQGTSYPDQIGLEAVRDVLSEGAHAVCKEAGITLDQIAFSFWGLPGFGENLANTEEVRKIVAEIVGNKQHQCGNDVEVGWAGSLAGQAGIHLVAGTGAIGYGQDPSGNTARSSGWSELLGDEGSAYWLGLNVLQLFTKQSDYRMPRSPLYSLIREKLQLERDLDLIAILTTKRNEIAQLAQVVFEAAKLGDKNALELYKEAAYEHSLTVKAIIEQLDFPEDEPIRVSYSGGVFKSGELILDPLREFLSSENVALQTPRLQPISGACLYALKASGVEVTEEIIENLAKSEQKYL